ncbi:MAG: hypothetical protein Q8N03_01820 [Ignavibacteria bacterium]|nr:hypothetical protein [Ignavibacteria bacterium]
MKKLLFVIFVMLLFIQSCSVYQTYVNLTRLKFKMGVTNNIRVAGIGLDGKSRISDFSPMDAVKFTSSFANGKLPVTLTINVEAKNPNDGTGGFPRTDASITSLPFRFILDGKEVVSGNLGNAVSVPGTGDVVNIPIQLSFDLVSMFKNKGYESLINLMLQISGNGGRSSSIEVYVRPTVSTALGSITYPSEIKLVDMEFKDK